MALAACATEGAGSTTNGGQVTSTQQEVTTSEATDTTSESRATTTLPAETSGTTSDRPLAPDFTLELAGGDSYTLSEGAKPVYLVFWAEW
jgi:hypothetical protein